MSTRAFDDPVDISALPYLTGDTAGIGGAIKQRDEDFLVEELPLYEPCGEGEHVYLFVEKQGMATLDMVGVVADHFGVETSAVGYAGMKDKRAITRQVVSVHVPGRSVDDFPMLTHERIRVLWADMHTNKLRLGHLRGNRFSVRIRGVSPTDVVRANGVLGRLAREGMPNYLGEQRFGSRQNNHVCGRLLLLGEHQGLLDAVLGPGVGGVVEDGVSALYAQRDYQGALAASRTLPRHEGTMLRRLAAGWNAKRVVGDIPRAQRRFWVAAFQSAVFNRVVGERVADGTLGGLSVGDVAMIHDNGACFRVGAGDLGAELDERLERLAVSPTGPLWGAKMMNAEGEAGARELDALAWGGFSPMELAVGVRQARVGLDGERRALRVPLSDPEIEGGMDEHGGYVRCAFTLPSGSFATVAVREVMKGGGGAADGGGEGGDRDE